MLQDNAAETVAFVQGPVRDHVPGDGLASSRDFRGTAEAPIMNLESRGFPIKTRVDVKTYEKVRFFLSGDVETLREGDVPIIGTGEKDVNVLVVFEGFPDIFRYVQRQVLFV